MKNDMITTGGAMVEAERAADNPAARYLLSLRSQASRYQMTRKLAKVAGMLGGEGASWQTFPWEQLRAVHVSSLVAALAETYSPAYTNTILAAVRGTMAQAHDMGLIDDKAARLIAKVPTLRGGSVDPCGRYVDPEERAALMTACLADETPAGRRDAAIVACAYPGGLRRAEIAGIQRESVTDDGDLVTLMVAGKGRKVRHVHIGNGGASAIRDYLTARGPADGPLFWRGVRGGRLLEGKGISSQGIYDILQKRANEAGLSALMPHDLRRTTASDLLDVADAVTVAAHLGHASVTTTAKYDRRQETAKRRAAGLLTIAYEARLPIEPRRDD